ncbi:succinylglutamate desuccinylase/aspartoacylase family protein [Arenibacter troitsensis]|uniref:Succinylglutamate desuccinylase / Aspartoacylase family protein n=1 Tax=Arenibacter troitsensis TaxID=188872 RepID=A0A1X7L6F2_9FLAO|nr:succinylglutamate desuccinylase/aspartoacylase family protein [Arenibacter troitsensis]SMG49426.1 Succinylglutamate desuccinylase / Aspartoacylase family protein [Arenibacter troitsensis]
MITIGKPVGRSRTIGHLKGDKGGPTMIFFGGIHGNEPSGEQAIQEVFNGIVKNGISANGNFYGIRGNVAALLAGKRFLDRDLNRLWTDEKIEKIKGKSKYELLSEDKELLSIHQILSDILKTESGPFYFIDFHTTSSKTLPFITINDALINRKFSKLFPVPIILGIEEYLEGPLLSYINERGYLSVGFESGQHTEREAVDNSIAFMWLALVYAGALKSVDIVGFEAYYRQLKNSAKENASFFEIIYRHPIESGEKFQMQPGFQSFDIVNKGKVLAEHNDKVVLAKQKSSIFMPLYQSQGEDGFFLIRKTPKFALWLSVLLRKIRMPALLPILPGVSWADKKNGTLLVNERTARFMAKPLFHLLGYRNRVINKSEILMTSREATAKNSMYKETWWYRNKKSVQNSYGMPS